LCVSSGSIDDVAHHPCIWAGESIHSKFGATWMGTLLAGFSTQTRALPALPVLKPGLIRRLSAPSGRWTLF